MVKGKIALLLGQADETYQSGFIRGVMKEAFRNDYSVYCFSMYIKYQNSREREIGDSNIFQLFDPAQFDAVIVLSDTIQTPGVEEEIEERLEKEFKGPVLCVDTDGERLPRVWSDGYESVFALVSHLIEVHNMKDIAFLTGKRKHRHSTRRLEAYRDAMAAHDLPVSEDRVFYGDFWYTSGNVCAEQLLRDRNNLPDALVSANDPMAIGAAEVFEKAGVRIPEDIALVGYGTSSEGENSPKSLTSCYVPAEDYGVSAVENVLRLMSGQEIKSPTPKTKLFIGESCGCSGTHIPEQSRRRFTWTTKTSEDGYYSIHNTMEEDLFRSNGMDEFLQNVYENLYYVYDIKRFDLCLNSQWQSQEELLSRGLPTRGYSDNLVHAISFSADNPAAGRLGMTDIFRKGEILPNVENDIPKGFIFTPLFYEDVSLGYAVISYGDEPRSYDEVYRLWVTSLGRGLETLRRSIMLRAIKMKMANMPAQKYNSGQVQSGEQTELTPEEKLDMETVGQILDGNLFTYHFQPIVSAVDGSIFSYEALMRSKTERRISPLTILKYADMMNRLVDVERDTMLNVLNIVEEQADIFSGKKVFINSIPGTVVSGEDQTKISGMIRKHPDTVVIELTEQAELSDSELDRLKNFYNNLGAGLAVDDYGTGYSNVSNLLRYMPDVVKIDRALLSDIQNSDQKQHFFRDIVEFCHGNDILALAEGVETSEELRTVILLGADLIQGYYTARPAAEILGELDENIKNEIVRYRREMVEGSGDEEYIAGRINRISVSQLLREHKTSIVIGDKNAAFQDITIVGTPGEIHRLYIEILEGYDGRVTLENVTLSNFKKRPCINMAENSRLVLRLVGANRMIDGGIQVPESSKLSLEGDGSLNIRIDDEGGFGIGNRPDRAHGEIEFYQDGEIRMDLNGNKVVGIGAGLGGSLQINRGKYDIYINGDECVGIGALEGESNLVMHDSDMQVDVASMQGVCIGSLRNSSSLEIWSSHVKCSIAGKRVSTLGTIKGRNARIDASESGMVLTVNADLAAGIGALNGHTEVSVGSATLRFNGSGNEIYCFGGVTEDTKASLTNSDVNIEIRSASGGVSRAPKEQIVFMHGRARIMVNEAIIR